MDNADLKVGTGIALGILYSNKPQKNMEQMYYLRGRGK
jgi:hypothetical protein